MRIARSNLAPAPRPPRPAIVLAAGACLCLPLLARRVPTALAAPTAPAAPAAPAAPQETVARPPLVSLVPSEALVYLGARELGALQQASRANAWGRMLRDPELQALWTWAMDRMAEEVDDPDFQEFRRLLPRFAEALQGELAAFVYAIPDHEPGFGVLVDPGTGRASFEELLVELDVFDGGEGSEFDQYAGVELTLVSDLAPTEVDAPSTTVHFDHGGLWCALGGDDREAVLAAAHGIIDRLAGSGEESLESSPLLAAARERAFPGRLELFADVQALLALDQGEDAEDEDLEAVFEALRLSEVAWVHGSADVGEGEALDLHLRISTPAKGYLADWLGALGPVPVALARLVPADAVQAALYNVDVFSIYDSAWDLFAELAPEQYEQARAQFEGGLALFGGLDPEGDFLAQLSGEAASFSVRVPEAELTSFEAVMGANAGEEGFELPEDLRVGEAYVVGLEDAQAVQQFLEQVLETVGGMMGLDPAAIETEDYRGHTVSVMELPNEMSFQWTFTGELWLGSLYPSALRSALSALADPDAASFASSKQFAPHLEQHAKASMLALAPSATSARLGFAGLRMIADMGGALLPDQEAFWDNVEAQEPVAWPIEDAPIPDGSVADRYLEGTLIWNVEYSPERHVLAMSMLAR